MVRGSKNKKQTRPMRSRTLLLSALTAATLATGLGIAGVRPAQAAGYVYQQHTLNAGVLVNDANIAGNGPNSNPAPYLFYVLNNRPDVRPVDLNLVNPLAPPTVTSAILNRWISYTLGQAITPNMAPYWEVSLNNVSDSQMAQYNVLYLRADGITFPPNINEKLRRFVDGGGQLIVEYGSAPSATGLFTGTGVGSGAGVNVTFPAASASALLVHPIVSQPYALSSSDLISFGMPSLALSANSGDKVHQSEFGSLFSPALAESAVAVVSAAQMGAGQVVASTLNIGGGISVHNAATFAAADLYSASAPVQTPDLKLLANIITWSETHPNENKTSHGNASAAGLASFSPAWQYLPTTAGANAPSGAAVWGNFVFAVDTNGVLRAFDAYPSQNLTFAATNITFGTAQTDDGVADYSTGTSYDEIWDSSGSNSSFAGASTPTVAAWGNTTNPTTNYVFVEKRDGTLAAFNAVTGAAAPFALTAPVSGGSFTGNAPAPTFYEGRLYAGQVNGTMHVYDLNEGTSAVVTLDPSTLAGGEPVTAAPSVGMLADGDVNVLVAVVPTTLNVYTVLLGGRNEPLSTFNAGGSLAGYSINRLGRYDLSNIFADANYSSLLAYDYSGNASATSASNTAPNPQDPLFAITNNAGYYTDWNMDFLNAAGSSTSPTQINLNFISADSYGQQSSPVPATAISAPAIDRHGSYYYTETLGANSYLVGVTNAPLYSHVQLKFRFRLPTTTGLVDADGVDYTQITGYHFVGAPVVDDQGNVYAAATDGTRVTVLCLRGDQPVSAIAPAGSTLDTSADMITQADEGGGSTDNTLARGDDSERFGQYIPTGPVTSAGTTTMSSLQFFSFGVHGSTQRQLVGNVTEPQPLTDTTTTTTLSMQTNLAWFVKPFALTAATVNGTQTISQISGLTQVGSSLLLTDGTSLYRLSTNPQVGASKVVSTAPSVTPLGVSATAGVATGVGTVASVPSVGGSVMVINGTGGIAARTRQVTVIADNNRILGVDGDGVAVWGIDATTRTDTTQTPSVSTKVPFSHPTALSQFAPNDYLVADTGSNRCVRFDSAGNVQWELTRFQDPYGLMGAGQPLTLSQPESVVVRTESIAATATTNPGGMFVYYLVADSGNDRIVEVADELDQTGAIFNNINHVLTWVTHTGDRYGRSYRYGSAAYYKNTQTLSNLSIAATVTNTRLAKLTANAAGVVTGLGAVSGDAPGGSLVVFNYPQAPVAYSNLATAPVDLVYTTAGFYAASGTGSSAVYTPFTIRSPRFLQLASSLTASAPVDPNATPMNPNKVPAFDFLYADDNGAFDLSYDATKLAFVAGADRLQFTTANYQAMATPVDASTTSGLPSTTYARTGLPFIPTCVQGLATDSQPTGTGTANLTRRYLITQNYSQGELGTPTVSGKIGGEVFEVDVSAPTQTNAGVTSVTGTSVVTAPGGFGGSSTLSHPALTGPLTQPTYAVRLP